MKKVARFFKTLSDPTRLRIMNLLLHRGHNICVCTMVNVLELPQTTISRQLGVLKNAGIVEDEREGTWMKYSITPSLDSFQKKTLNTLKKHTAEEDSFLLDIASFDRKRQAGELVLFCGTEENEGRKTA